MTSVFSVSTTSSKPPYLVRDEIQRVLGNLNVKCTTKGFDITCSYVPPSDVSVEGDREVTFEISIVKVKFLNLYGLLMKKNSGDVVIYKSLCGQILSTARL